MEVTYTDLAMTRRKWGLLGFLLGMVPSLLLFFWANQRVNDLKDLFDLMRSANVGNHKAEVVTLLGPGRKLSVEELKRYQPLPAKREGSESTTHVNGRYLLYVWYDQADQVVATFIAKRE